MKPFFRLAIYSLFLLSTSLFSASSFAEVRGHEVGNGGDSLVIKIRKGAELIEQRLSDMNTECSSRLTLSARDFSSLLARVKIETQTEPLFLVENGRQVFKEAINYPASVRIVFNRGSFLASETKEQLIVHEFLGLAGIDDKSYTESSLISSLSTLHVCRKSDAAIATLAGLPVNLNPSSAAIDLNDVLYMTDDKYEKIFRFDLNTKEALPPIEVRSTPKKVVFSRALNRLYIASAEGRISMVNLGQAPLVEKPFAILPDEISQLAAVGDMLFVIPSNIFDWGHHYAFDQRGRVHATDMSDPVASPIASSDQENVLYVSNFNPHGLHRAHLKNGRISKVKESWDAHSYDIGGPLAASKDLVAVGSGQIFTTDGLKFTASIGEGFTGAVWLGGHLATILQKDNGFVFKVWNSQFSGEDKVQPFTGTFLQILENKQNAVILYFNQEKALQIETVRPN
jgi:hypothetical protein